MSIFRHIAFNLKLFYSQVILLIKLILNVEQANQIAERATENFRKCSLLIFASLFLIIALSTWC